MNSDGPESKGGRVSVPPSVRRPDSIPPAIVPGPVSVDARVRDQGLSVSASVRGAVPVSPNARNIDGLATDMRYLLHAYKGDIPPMILDATTSAAEETKRILHFLFGARIQMRNIQLAPFAQNKITAANEKVKSGVSTYEDTLFQHVVAARTLEDGLAEKGYRWAFQQIEGGITYTPQMVKLMHEIVKTRGFDIKQDVDGIVKNLNEEYMAKGIKPSREQFVEDFQAVIEVMGHHDDYDATERPSVTSIQSQKTKIQQFLQNLGNSFGTNADSERWKDIIDTNLERIGDPAQYFHFESLLFVASNAAKKPLSPESVRYAVSAINRYLMQAYYAAFELKLIGKSV